MMNALPTADLLACTARDLMAAGIDPRTVAAEYVRRYGDRAADICWGRVRRLRGKFNDTAARYFEQVEAYC